MQSVGWIGLGKMGDPMARNLIKAGVPLSVYNRTRERTRDLQDAGANIADSLVALAGAVDVVISMVSDDTALEAISFGHDGAFQAMAPGSVFIDMSTVSPALSARVAEAANANEIKYLRAPVSGSIALAAAATLTILVSGPRDSYDQCLPLFEAMGAKQYHVGIGEEARVLKLSLNMMVGITAAMMGEALAFGEGGGLDWEQMLEIISNSAVASPLVGYKVAPLKARDFTPAFTASQMAKDFDLALNAAKDTGVPMPVTSLVRRFWGDMEASGKGEMDFFAYVTLLEEMAGIETKNNSGG
ncbi:MAG: NAD(P)-dependent oxidoreductase [Rhodospirillales bacterium]|nr:NAD(P)-dependent oxidoreductase [Rhodospirillales bacterium]